jgi:hypothetical protein
VLQRFTYELAAILASRGLGGAQARVEFGGGMHLLEGAYLAGSEGGRPMRRLSSSTTRSSGPERRRNPESSVPANTLHDVWPAGRIACRP